MDLKQLQDYNEWLKVSPDEVLRSVKNVGGWHIVFPASKAIPRWASRVRNYFNYDPQVLKRLDERSAAAHLDRVKKNVEALSTRRLNHILKKHGAIDTLKGLKIPGYAPQPAPADSGITTIDDEAAEKFALSDDVYVDEFNRVWFQMSPGGAIHHWGSDPWFPEAEAPWQSIKGGQRYVPVFKLVSPDGTGGSAECCIRNPLLPWEFGGVVMKRGAPSIGKKVNQWTTVVALHVTSPKYQGSYNYSETIEKGFPDHEMRDVTPHPHRGVAWYYVDPVRFSALGTRIFPQFARNERIPLAQQI